MSDRRRRLREIARYLAESIKAPPRLFARKESLSQLVLRAGRTEYDFETGVVPSSDNVFRIGVGYYMPEELSTLGCISVDVYLESDRTDAPGRFRRAHFSPARARILAHHLLVRAERAEAKHGLKPLDPEAVLEDLD